MQLCIPSKIYNCVNYFKFFTKYYVIIFLCVNLFTMYTSFLYPQPARRLYANAGEIKSRLKIV